MLQYRSVRAVCEVYNTTNKVHKCSYYEYRKPPATRCHD